MNSLSQTSKLIASEILEALHVLHHPCLLLRNIRKSKKIPKRSYQVQRKYSSGFAVIVCSKVVVGIFIVVVDSIIVIKSHSADLENFLLNVFE